MSSMSDSTPLLRKWLLLDLLSVRHYLSETNLTTSNLDELTGVVMYCQFRAFRLQQRGDDWRNHKVRSKHYKGKLGDLFDEFKPYWNPTVVKV